jgi:CCR4-NOT transcription complex subunit 7/8
MLYQGREWVDGQLKYRPHYDWIMKNVNELKIIQIGITVADERGRTPSPISTWQFNMHFDLQVDKHNTESIEMLKKAGLDFEKHAKDGINHL